MTQAMTAIVTPIIPDNRLVLSERDMADLFGYSKKTILRMAADGELPRPIIDQPRRRRWSRKQVEDWIRRRERV